MGYPEACNYVIMLTNKWWESLQYLVMFGGLAFLKLIFLMNNNKNSIFFHKQFNIYFLIGNEKYWQIFFCIMSKFILIHKENVRGTISYHVRKLFGIFLGMYGGPYLTTYLSNVFTTWEKLPKLVSINILNHRMKIS